MFERTIFRTPYWPARLEVSCQPASFMAAQGGRTLIEARRAAKPVPDLPLWVAALALHYTLLRAGDRAATERGLVSGWNYLVHAGSVWLLTGMVADSLDLGIDHGGDLAHGALLARVEHVVGLAGHAEGFGAVDGEIDLQAELFAQ